MDILVLIKILGKGGGGGGGRRAIKQRNNKKNLTHSICILSKRFRGNSRFFPQIHDKTTTATSVN